mmetsp:Transcript_18626/g.26765  ORF Transcript_18626/g.26765 Transcript_18626/m.26765 type:complete len:104 (+) Transcript_18626:614-925(+)
MNVKWLFAAGSFVQFFLLLLSAFMGYHLTSPPKEERFPEIKFDLWQKFYRPIPREEQTHRNTFLKLNSVFPISITHNHPITMLQRISIHLLLHIIITNGEYSS